jgi:L-amino acid N-acyltransferase YncA
VTDEPRTLLLRTDLSIQLRRARRGDLPAIARIYDRAVLETTATFEEKPRTEGEWVRWLEEEHGDRYPAWAVLHEGEVVAFCSLSPMHRRSAYRFTCEPSVYLEERVRHRGIGRALLAFLEEEAKALGYHAMVSRICFENQRSVRMMTQLGHQHVGTEREVGYKFDRWLDVGIFHKIL